MYYYMKNGLVHIHVENTLSKYQDQLLQTEKKLGTALYCELVDKIFKDSYLEYILLYDINANRIGINDIVAENSQLKLRES